MKCFRKFFSKYVFIGLVVAIAQSGIAWGQGGTLEEVVVTAQYREQSIQDVPISVTALSAELLEAAGIFDPTTMAMNVPGMAYAEFSPGQALISLRGITSADDGAGLDNSVGVFLDGAYIGRQAGIVFDLFDLERIEVLKGPQGTLFGRNSIAGAISVVTSKPSNEFEGKVALTVGNEGILRGQALITGPLSENLSAKLVVSHREHDGFVRNTLLQKDVMDEDYTSGRGQLLWETENSDWLLSLDTMEDDRGDMGRVPIANGNFDYLGTAASLGAGVGFPGTSAAPLDGFTKRKGKGGSLTGNVSFDAGTFTTITSLRNIETDWEMPSIGAPAGGMFNLAAGVFGVDVNDKIEEETDTFTQEFRWTSAPGDTFDYVAGLYFLTEDTDRTEQFLLEINTAAGGQNTLGNEYSRTQNETTSYAAYGQANWYINEAWTWTFGGRYTKDERDYIATAVNCGHPEAVRAAAGFPNFPNCQGVGGGSIAAIAQDFEIPASNSWTDFSPMTSLQFQQNDNLMYYGTISTGYKSGGYAGSQGLRIFADREVKPEGVINYEIGFKGEFADNSLRLNASAFYMDYTDLQVVRFGPVAISPFGTFQTTNIGSAEITGIEIDYLWQATDAFSLSGYYAYLDSEVNDLTLNSATGPQDFSGVPLRQSPEHSYSIIGEYIADMSGGSALTFRAQYAFVDEQFNDYPTRDETVIEAAKLLDASIKWMSAEGQYELVLWGKNLTDERYISHSYRIGPGSIGVWSDPRTFGLTGTFHF